MKFEIKHRYSGNVLLSMDTDSVKPCVEGAVKIKAKWIRNQRTGKKRLYVVREL